MFHDFDYEGTVNMGTKAKDWFLNENEYKPEDLSVFTLWARLNRMSGIEAEDDLEVIDYGSWILPEHRELSDKNWTLYCCEGMYPVHEEDGTIIDADTMFCACLYKGEKPAVSFACGSGSEDTYGAYIAGAGTYLKPIQVAENSWRWQECGPDHKGAQIAKEFIEERKE